MKNVSFFDVAGYVILAVAIVSIVILFTCYGNGQFVANIVTG